MACGFPGKVRALKKPAGEVYQPIRLMNPFLGIVMSSCYCLWVRTCQNVILNGTAKNLPAKLQLVS